MNFQSLQPGMTIEGYELLAPLNPGSRFMPTWKALGADGEVIVLRFLADYGLADVPQKEIEPFMKLPPIPGFVPWLGWSWATVDGNTLLVIRRPYFQERLTDSFLPDAANPPNPALLDAFGQLATTFDSLQSHYPSLNFDLAPGNLLLDGDTPVLVDYGLAHHLHYSDMNNRMPFSSHVEHERRVPLSASYPSIWSMWSATKSPYSAKIQRTDAQYALAVLYVYLRTRFLVFEDSTDPFPNSAELSHQESIMAKLKWVMTLHDTVQAYEENGTLSLSMLPGERERAIVSRALSRYESARFASCSEFIQTLKSL